VNSPPGQQQESRPQVQAKAVQEKIEEPDAALSTKPSETTAGLTGSGNAI
jgi:hypothetical protein